MLDLGADGGTLTAQLVDVESVSGDERPLADAIEAAGGDAERLRVVVDQVASMTDAAAIERHRLLHHPTATRA